MLAALPPAPPAVIHVVPASPFAVATDSTHRVRWGETVSHIALRYRVSQASLRHANGIGADGAIREGQRLTVPGASRSAAQTSRSARLPAAAGLSASRVQTRDIIAETARRHGVSPDLALAVAWQESRWRPNSTSHKGAVGAMQCMPSTGRWMSQVTGRSLDLRNVRDNATCGVLLIKTLQRQTTSDAMVIAGYYQGLEGVRAKGMYSDTVRYVRGVQDHRNRIAAGQMPRD